MQLDTTIICTCGTCPALLEIFVCPKSSVGFPLGYLFGTVIHVSTGMSSQSHESSADPVGSDVTYIDCVITSVSMVTVSTHLLYMYMYM